LVHLNCRIYVISYVGWTDYLQYDDSQRIQDVLNTVGRTTAQYDIPTLPDTDRRIGAVISASIVNHRTGIPFRSRHHNDALSTGGKDYQMYRLHAPVLIDDHAGMCCAARDIGGAPFLVQSRRSQHHVQGLASFADFPAAVRSLSATLQNPRARQNLIEQGRNLRRPSNAASRQYDFHDAADAPRGTRFW
jgi:hypothetical protein